MIALEKYKKAATVLGLFIHNEEELKDCMDKLDFQKLRLKINLKQLLLPLSKDPCQLYLSNLKGMQQTMKQLNSALHAETHDPISGDPIQASSAEERGSRQSYRFRFKFGTGEGERNRLFNKLESYNDRLEEILSLSDKDAQLTSQPSTSMDTTQQTSGQLESSGQIEDLCFSLRELDDDCCGYLSHDDGRYYVYAEDQESHGWQTHVTLEGILKAPKSHRIARWQSFAISVILASSFVQLLDTPWLPESLSKSDIIFFQDEEQPGQFMVDRPHVTCRFVDRERDVRGSSRRIAVESLECLGILLLELLFRDVLEEQPCRTQFKESARALDVVAAHLWLTAVEQEAGADIQGAIAWCLKGNQSMQGSPDEWRRDMLTKVIQPLQAEMKHIRPGE
ncbi:hypothetical protein F5X68DRAFT_265708 [Plectosphaerella plurivora]|uniref:DUF7580 domain-containing protein n=1 Tax=Plectosphaerella plurivora TaxID=936078 RepID=A0A9P8V1U1_9PEZI|nr:hypothetical protein F5X68DRAFT_265708 [Plectosphaerella plurivora]